MPEYICPNCKNSIFDDEALLCHFCGESLQRPGNGFLSKMRYSQSGLIWIILAVVALLAFILLFVL